jgi:hypothetical protein
LQAQQERVEHRVWIAGRVLTVLSHYWRDDDDEALTSAIAADWADVLEGLPQDAIQKACIQYQRKEAWRKPTPGAIYALARDFMPRPAVVRSEPAPEPPKERCDPKVAQAICEAAGFTPKRFGGDT